MTAAPQSSPQSSPRLATAAASTTPVVWAPGSVNRTPTGGTPTGSFAVPGAAGAGLGVQPFYGIEQVALTPTVTAMVNVATGNLVLHSEDVALNAPGLSVHLDSFHNSRAGGDGSLGDATVFSTGQDVGLQVGASSVTFAGPSGFTGVFTAATGGGWSAPAGLNADLVHNGDGTWTLTYHRSGEH